MFMNRKYVSSFIAGYSVSNNLFHLQMDENLCENSALQRLMGRLLLQGFLGTSLVE